MKKLLLVIFTFLYCQCWSQGNMITINSTVPAQMTICGAAKVFTVTIYNPSPFTLTDVALSLTMPTGISYVPASVTGPGVSDSNISILNQPIFTLPSLPTWTTLNISFSVVVGCDVMAYISGGGVVENKIRVDYTGNNNQNFDEKTTATYIIRQPSLSITSITNQSFTGSIGAVFTRCITIINGGFGELSQFTLTEVHGSGIDITGVSKGAWTSSGTTETIFLSGVNFSGIGDGDNLFENGESITICDTVHVLNCISVGSAFEAYWGCNSQHCQSSVSSANVVFPNLIPNLVITPTGSMNTCMGAGNASLQKLKIVNNGLGMAVNVLLDIFQCGGAGAGYQNGLGSEIDTSSLTIQIGVGGAPVSIAPTSVVATAALACMTSPIGKFSLTIPYINAGDTVYIKWNTYTCCYNACTNTGAYDVNGWRYSGNYSNICQSNYIIPEAWGRVYSRLRAGLNNNGSPATLSDGQTGTFNFSFSYYENSFPVGPGAYWKFEFTLPSCLSYSGNLHILRSTGLTSWTPSTVNISGNVVTAIFTGSPLPLFNLNKAEIMIDLTVDCSACVGTNIGAVGIQAFYVPDSSCPCEIVVACSNASINVLCPFPCPEGMLFRYFEMKRTSYGLPDNEAGGGDGLPDAIGSLDFTKIKTDRAMFGDTITSSFNGIVKNSPAYPFWHYCFAISSITNGNRLTFVDAKLLIYRGGLLLTTGTNYAPVVSNSGSTRIFKYNLSDSLGSCVPGFVYQDNDSVVFKPRYRVSSNVGNATPLNCYSSNEFYFSDIATFPSPPTPAANKFQCADYNGNCTLIGYYFTNYGPDKDAVKSCNNVTLSQNYYLSIGPCCNNHAGGNLFPYEYRNWAHIDILTSIPPPGYDFIYARFNQSRTAGTLVINTSPWDTILPVNPNSDTLVFPVEQYFLGYGGTIPLSDDGFYGTLEVVVRPSCEVTPTISQGIRDSWTFAATPNNYLTGTGSASTLVSVVQDSIIYQAPDLFLQSTLPSVLAPDNTATWDICIPNTSNVSNALNTWISGPATSGVSIINVVDLGTGLPITPLGDIYPAGTVNATATRCFRITATFTSCAQDSILIYSGWNCNAGYPASVQTYPCTPKTIVLKVTPLMPALVLNITAPPGTIQLCDTATYTIEGINVQLGTAYNILLTAVLPVGVDIVAGSSQLTYPLSGAVFAVSDPVFISGTTWQWSVDSISSIINANGLKGVLEDSLSSFKLTFDVTTDCGYTSGSTIGFNIEGVAACGLTTGKEVLLSSALGITGAATPYNTVIDLNTTYISPCADNSVMTVVVHNLGPLAFGNADSVILILPAGVSFVDSSFSAIYNAPNNGVPLKYSLNGKNYLIWQLPNGVIAGDSSIFTFDFNGDAEVLSCGISEIEAKTTRSTNVYCLQSGNSCGINIATGDTLLSIYTYKAYLSLSNGNATSVPNPPGGETVTVNLNITNTGQAINSGANSIIQFYFDANGNGIYNSGDVFITQDTLSITNNATVPYSHTFDVASGQACSIIAIIDTAVNPCVCNPTQLQLQPPLISFTDSTLCSGQTMTLNHPLVTGYTYSWTPGTGLSNTNISNPLLTSSNLTAIPVLTTYVLATTRIGCISYDTSKITVNPIPVSNAGGDILTCPTNTLDSIGAASIAGYTYLWSPSIYLNDSTLSNPVVTLITPDTIIYTVTTTSLGCSSADNVIIQVNPLPTATISGTVFVCNNGASPNITFKGTGATPPYTITYNLNGGANQTINTLIGDSVTLSVPTGVVGTFIYYLVSIQEASFTSCIQDQSDSVIITVNPLPTASIFGTIEVCKNDTTPTITFEGSSGTPPYTFTYSINGGTNQTVSTTVGDSANIFVPTTVVGTFTYSLIKVQDASSTLCSQLQTGSATITVNPLPVADFSFANVCLNQVMNFIDQSTISNDSITSWLWDFGDDSPLFTSQDTSHLYTSFGTDTVSLITTTNKGCKDTISKSIVVHPLPDAQFYTIPVAIGICDEDSIRFNDASTIAAPDNLQSWVWNFGDNTIVGGSSISHTYSAPGSYTVHLTVLSDFGCPDTTIGLITINPNPVVDFNVSETAGCVPLCVVFTDLSTIVAGAGNVQWWWNFGDGSTSAEPYHCYTGDLTYSPVITLTVTSDSGCVTSLSKNNYISVYPNPHAEFSVAPETTTVLDPIISFVDLSSGASIWNWDFGDNGTSTVENPSPYAYAAVTGTYVITLITSTQYGCKDTAYQTIFIDADFAFYIPNSFTPDGDGINDYFFGKGVGIIKYNLWIFDRWGNMIFDGSDLDDKWDGRANRGDAIAQMDVYVWKVKLTDVFNRVHKYSGTVTLVR